MGEMILKISLSLVPSLILILGGQLFKEFNVKTWNNPLTLIFTNKNRMVNWITGQLWVIGGIINLIITIVFGLFNHPVLMVSLYFMTVILTFVSAYFIIKTKLRAQEGDSL